MTYIITPSRSHRLPLGPVRLNRRSELVQNLKALWVPNWADTRSLVELVSRSVDAGTGTIIPAMAGDTSRGLDFTAASNYVSGGARAINTVTVDHISVMALIIPGALTRGDLITRWVNGAGAGDQFNLLYGLTSGKARFYSANTDAGTSHSGDATTVMAVGSQYMIGGSGQSNTFRRVYTNGTLEAEVTVGLGIMRSSPTTAYRIGDNAGADGNFNGKFFFGAVWDEMLDSILFREVCANPYQLVESIQPKLYFIPAQAPLPSANVSLPSLGPGVYQPILVGFAS
jgi:hypothetical protein